MLVGHLFGLMIRITIRSLQGEGNSSKTYWTCSKFRDKAILCKSRAVTNSKANVIITLTGTHTNHGSELMTN